MSAVMVSMAVLSRAFSSGILAGKRRNINLILDVTHGKKSHGVACGEGGGKLLKPWHSFLITLYLI